MMARPDMLKTHDTEMSASPPGGLGVRALSLGRNSESRPGGLRFPRQNVTRMGAMLDFGPLAKCGKSL